jgi:hypothetical protein
VVIAASEHWAIVRCLGESGTPTAKIEALLHPGARVVRVDRGIRLVPDRQALDDLGLTRLLGSRLLERIDAILSRHDLTPSVAAEELAPIVKEIDERLSQKMDRVSKELGEMGITQGQIAEDLFYRNVGYLFEKQEMIFSDIRRNVKKKGIAEYDIVAVNKDKVLVIEVKNKLEKRSVDKFLEKMLPKFKKVFPEYRDYDLIGGVGGLVVKDDVGQYAQKAGLYVLTQKGDGGATLLNRKNFKAKSFC